LTANWKTNDSAPNDSKHCLTSICFSFLTEEDFDLLFPHWEDLGIDGWIILGWISRRWDVGIWTGLGWPRIETVGGPL